MSDERKRLVDELGALEEEIAPLKPKIKRAEALRKLARTWAEADQVDAAAPVLYPGSKYNCLLTAAEARGRIASLPKLFRLLGQKQFLAKCGFTLKALEETGVTPPPGLVVTEMVGARDVHTVRKAA